MYMWHEINKGQVNIIGVVSNYTKWCANMKDIELYK